MQALFSPERHEPLIDAPWDPGAAADAIAAIVADTLAAARPDGLWPNHPNDFPESAPPAAGLYFGAAGVIWTLDWLAREGAAPAGRDFSGCLADLVTRNPVQARGLLLATGGTLALQAKLAPSAAVDDALATLIADNTDDPALELMWGAPGTMLVALFRHRATGEARWAALFRAGAAALERAFEPGDRVGWSQNLRGRRQCFVGAVHGFAGNAYVLWAGRELLDEAVWARWSRRFAQSLGASALAGGDGVNWPAVVGDSWPPAADDFKPLVQHCHGAPGMVTSLAGLDEPIDDLLLGGGELIWTAGPLTKGANLCHGTAGNGYAFLKLFERTGDQLWLDRARSFAMHAIAQSDAEARSIGRRRSSLWTGDLGLAVYLLDCVRGRARFPTLDVF